MELKQRISDLITKVWHEVPLEEQSVLHVICDVYISDTRNEGKRVTQADIARSERVLGCHPKWEEASRNNKRDSTHRQVRQLIRNLRVTWGVPILSDTKGYWLPSTQQEVIEYIERKEGEAKAVTKSWFETYAAVRDTLNVTSSFFEGLDYES